MKPLTARQRSVLGVFANLCESKGYPPTVRDVATALGMSHHGAECHLLAIERKGCVTSALTRSRTRVVTPEGWKAIGRRSPKERGVTGTIDQGTRCPGCDAQLFGDVSICSFCKRAA